MLIDLTGRVALVTGAGRGIGHDLALRLADEGVTTVGLDVVPDGLVVLEQKLTERDATFSTFECDVTDLPALQRVVAAITDRYGRLDILVNNAGVVAGGPVDQLPEDAWRHCLDVNLTGTFLACKAVVPVMKRQRAGRIINAASFAAIVPTVAATAYASSKAAVAHFTRTLAGELGPWHITANAYAPGMVPTQMNHFTERPQPVQDQLLDLLTLRRWETTTDVANLICFLASDQAEYITGTLIDVSGGKLATQIPAAGYQRARTDDPELVG